MTVDRQRVARRVLLLRRLRGWDQTGLAEHSGLSEAYVRAVEAAEAVPLDGLPALSRALGIAHADLLAATPLGVLRLLLTDGGEPPASS